MKGTNWHLILAGLLVAIIHIGGDVASAETRRIAVRFDTKQDFEAGTADFAIDTTAVPGEVRLMPSVLIHDEIGDGNAAQGLSDSVWIKKEFILDTTDVSFAQILTFNGPKKMKVNGHEVEEIVHQPDGGWYRADIPVSHLRRGLNEVVMWGGGGIYIEPHFSPAHSAKSTDGGKTWHYINGEYMVRLRLGRYPRAGSIISPVVDLGSLPQPESEELSPLSHRISLYELKLTSEKETPPGTNIALQVRGGSTPSYSPDSWSDWRPADAFLEGVELPTTVFRYIQWQANLSSDNPRQTPILRSVTLEARVEVLPAPWSEKIKIRRFQNQKIIRSSWTFAYQEPSERLEFLRSDWKLDEVVAPGKTELEKFILLRDWVKHQWKGWEGSCDRPWDAINILSAPENDRGMCVHFGVVFAQCALALGYNARHVILNHHFVSEVWSNEYKKWILMDAGPAGGVDGHRNMHFLRDGIPQNALELHRAWAAGEGDKIMIEASNPADNRPYGDDVELYCRFFLPLRNNYLDVPEPAEDAHGIAHYHYDGYLWWEDSLSNLRSPEYSLQSARENDFYWTLNQVELHLQYGEQEGQLLVQMDTVTPNFKAYSVKIDDQEWQERPASFIWSLHPGENKLQAKTINAFGLEGIVSSIEVEYRD